MARAKKKAEPAPVWTGAEELRGQLVDIKSLTLDPKNARRHPDHNLAAIKRSLGKFGQVKPVVVREGVVVAGNGLVQAGESLGWSHIAVLEFGHTVADAAEYGIMDNRSAELAEWDTPQLAELLQGIQGDDARDILDTGFSGEELTELLESIGQFSAEEVGMPHLPDGDRAPFRQMTFTLSDAQAGEVKSAMVAAKAAGPFVDTGNENSNGNALARIVEAYVG